MENKKKTYREIFGNMPPLKHDKDIDRSEVVNWILNKMMDHDIGICNPQEAYRIFGILRNVRKSRILVHRSTHDDWVGCNTEDAWKYRFNKMENDISKIQKDIKVLFELTGSRR